MRWPGLRASIIGTVHATVMIYMVLLGADVLNAGLTVTQLPGELADWVKGSGLAPLLVMAAILVIYILLGCVMDSLAMILLTIPIFCPRHAGRRQVHLVRHPVLRIVLLLPLPGISLWPVHLNA